MKNARTKLIAAIALVAMLSMTVMTLAACGGVSFKVNFMVDGQVCYTINTNGQEVIQLPENPTKEGYTFKGWFWDDNIWQKPFTANSLLDAPLSGDMNVYARFVESSKDMVDVPVAGTAYKLFVDQENAGVRVYLNGAVDTYYLSTTTDISQAVNVYIEESDIAGKYHMFCVHNGSRQYINIVRNGNFLNAVYNKFTNYCVFLRF